MKINDPDGLIESVKEIINYNDCKVYYISLTIDYRLYITYGKKSIHFSGVDIEFDLPNSDWYIYADKSLTSVLCLIVKLKKLNDGLNNPGKIIYKKVE